MKSLKNPTKYIIKKMNTFHNVILHISHNISTIYAGEVLIYLFNGKFNAFYRYYIGIRNIFIINS